MKFTLGRQIPLWSACSFPNCLIREGKIQTVAYRDPSDIRARTAIGINLEQTELIILVIDGGDYNVKRGANFLETTQILQDNGAWLGIMGDGGGSTTLVKQGPEIVNVPCGENYDHQRSVAQHMGIQLKGV